MAIGLCLGPISCLPDLELPACSTIIDCPLDGDWSSCRDGLCFKFSSGGQSTTWPTLTPGEWHGFAAPTPPEMSFRAAPFVVAVEIMKGLTADLTFLIDVAGSVTVLKSHPGVAWNDPEDLRSATVVPKESWGDSFVISVRADDGSQERSVEVQYRLDFEPPVVSLDASTSSLDTVESKFKVSGFVVGEKSVAKEVRIECHCEISTQMKPLRWDGGKYGFAVDPQNGGVFDLTIELRTPGEQTVIVQGVDSAGNISDPKTLTVDYNPK
jgi:hypothetical protein